MAFELGSVVDGTPILERIEWVPQLELAIDLRLDPIAAVMVALISGIGVLVCVFALGYFSHPEPGTGRLAGLLTMFAGAMLGVVLSDHLITLFLFWELTSVTSYLLIANDDRNPRGQRRSTLGDLDHRGRWPDDAGWLRADRTVGRHVPAQ